MLPTEHIFLRADIDLGALESRSVPPTSVPVNGSYWLDTASTIQGVKRWDGSSWKLQKVNVVESVNLKTGNVPKNSYGKLNDYAVVYEDVAGSTTSNYSIYQKTTSSRWELCGSSAWTLITSNELQFGKHTDLPLTRKLGGALTKGDLFYQYNSLSNGTDFSLRIYDSTSSQFLDVDTNYCKRFQNCSCFI